MIHNDKQGKNVTEGVVPDLPDQPGEFKLPRTLISSDRHSNTTSEDLSERWSINVAQAKLKLKASTQRVKISAVMPFSCIYRSVSMFGVKLLDFIMAKIQCTPRNKWDQGQNSKRAPGSMESTGTRQRGRDKTRTELKA